jgi:hypothetical protein
MLKTLSALIHAYKNYDLTDDEATDFINSYRMEQYDPCDDDDDDEDY